MLVSEFQNKVEMGTFPSGIYTCDSAMGSSDEMVVVSTTIQSELSDFIQRSFSAPKAQVLNELVNLSEKKSLFCISGI